MLVTVVFSGAELSGAYVRAMHENQRVETYRLTPLLETANGRRYIRFTAGG